MSTGWSFSLGSKLILGVGQCKEGERSKLSVEASGKPVFARIPTMLIIAATDKAAEMLVRLARVPQIKLPAAIEPKKQIR